MCERFASLLHRRVYGGTERAAPTALDSSTSPENQFSMVYWALLSILGSSLQYWAQPHWALHHGIGLYLIGLDLVPS